MTTSGRTSLIAAWSRGKSRTSAYMERTSDPTSACINRLGLVGGSSAYPVTFAPSASSHSDSQLPLKPVCPVTKTRRPFQNEWLSMVRRDCRGLIQVLGHCLAGLGPSRILLLPERFD